MVYPTFMAVIGDVAHPAWHAASLGAYASGVTPAMWQARLLAGAAADAFGQSVAMQVVAMVTFFSGVVVASRMCETRPLAVSTRADEGEEL